MPTRFVPLVTDDERWRRGVSQSPVGRRREAAEAGERGDEGALRAVRPAVQLSGARLGITVTSRRFARVAAPVRKLREMQPLEAATGRIRPGRSQASGASRRALRLDRKAP